MNESLVIIFAFSQLRKEKGKILQGVTYKKRVSPLVNKLQSLTFHSSLKENTL